MVALPSLHQLIIYSAKWVGKAEFIRQRSVMNRMSATRSVPMFNVVAAIISLAGSIMAITMVSSILMLFQVSDHGIYKPFPPPPTPSSIQCFRWDNCVRPACANVHQKSWNCSTKGCSHRICICLSLSSMFIYFMFILLTKCWMYQCRMSSSAPCMYLCYKDVFKKMWEKKKEKKKNEIRQRIIWQRVWRREKIH